jgi:hypothetical protein
MKRVRVFLTFTTAAAMAFSLFGGLDLTKVKASTAPQTLPFTQNWSDAGLITTNNDWSGVAGIVGYRGDELIAATGVDPRTILADGSGTPINVTANQANPNTLTAGGIAEFAISDPVVAFQGSGTADAPHIVIYLNTTGQSNIRFQCDLRDIDGSGDDTNQQIAVQYRIGGTGNYANVPGRYFEDVTSGPDTATMVTPVDLTLPSDADNQSLVEIRVITTNAPSTDEWVGVDNISVTGGEAPPAGDAVLDFDGDGKTDLSLVRNTGGGTNGQITWFNLLSGGGIQGSDFGVSSDIFVPADYDGDGKDDIAVWRPSEGVFYIFESSTGSVRIEQFGQEGDDPNVVADYDGDGKADIAVYRAGSGSGEQSTWYYRTEANGGTYYVPWGQAGDYPAPGDYDGDGKNDFVIQRDHDGSNAIYWMLYSNSITSATVFGSPTDLLVPGDYDGDGKTDLAVVRSENGQFYWYCLPSGSSGYTLDVFGSTEGDYAVPGDYDGDGKTDIAIWRPGSGEFWVRRSSDSTVQVTQWGQDGDYPTAYNRTF